MAPCADEGGLAAYPALRGARGLLPVPGMAVPTLGLVARYLDAVIAAWEELHGTERVFAIEPKEARRIAGLIRIRLDGDESGAGKRRVQP